MVDEAEIRFDPDIPTLQRLKPTRACSTRAIDDQAQALAYQRIIGLGIEIPEKVLLIFGYRYLVPENIRLGDVTAAPFEIASVPSTFELGLRTTF